MRARRRGKKLEFRFQQARSACARSTAFNTPLCRRDGTRLILLASKLIVFCANWVYKWKPIRSRRSTATLAKKFIFALLDFSHGRKILIFNAAINNDRDSTIARSIEIRAKYATTGNYSLLLRVSNKWLRNSNKRSSCLTRIWKVCRIWNSLSCDSRRRPAKHCFRSPSGFTYDVRAFSGTREPLC